VTLEMSARAMRPGGLVWITRTLPAAEATAERVRALGFQALVRPLLEVRPVDDRPIDLAGVAAIALTSANAVVAFAARSDDRSLRVFTVGAATAAAARAAGFASVFSADGDVAALAAALAARRREIEGLILYPSAAEPAQDLGAALAAAGLAVRRVPLYETVPVRPAPALIARLPDIDAALLHSPSAARALANLLAAHPAPGLIAACLSANVAEPLASTPLAARLTARAPNETALLALLTDGQE
jgi:uroporphyrinogen-III synthase